MKTIYYCHDQQSGTDARRSDLEMAGYRVMCFETGGDLMRAIAQEYPDLVLVDVLLHGKNGFEVCQGMGLNESLNFPVVLFGGVYSRPSFREHALSMGITGFIEATPSPLELLAEVNRQIRAFAADAGGQAHVA